MSKWFSNLPVISLVLLQGQAWGWGAQHTLSNLEYPKVPDSIHFPLNNDQAWFVKPSYLIWKPLQDGTDIGSKVILDTVITNNFQESTTKIQNLDFEWGSGVRIGVGRYLPKHEQWDISFFMTYLYSDAEKDQKVALADLNSSTSGDSFFSDGWADLLNAGLKSHTSWHVNYFTWDLLVGRNYALTRSLVLHPFIGVRAALIDQKYSTHSTVLRKPFGALAFVPARFKAFNDFWGIGARIGTDFSYYFGQGWSWIGLLSGSFLLSHYEMKEKVFSSFINPTPNSSIKVRDADTVLRTNLEAALGLGWEKWVRNHSVRIAPSFLFEITEWYSINPWVENLNLQFGSAPGITLDSQRRKQRDLGFFGFSVNLQVDY